MSARVPGFRPSASGLHFPNAFPPGPLLEVRLGGLRVPIGDASRGVCGGMVFAARDYFEADRSPPPDRAVPAPGTPLFRYLVRRLFASFNLPLGPLRYLWWMWLPAGDRLGLRGRGRRTVEEEWPKVRADLDAGRPSPLGLVRTRSLSPLDLGRNHQVLAYGYDLEEATGSLTVHVYDPNHPDDDAVALRLALGDPARPVPIAYLQGEAPVLGFFRTAYRFAPPPES